MKLAFNDIKKEFEHKDYDQRDNFISNYNFKDNYLNYYHHFIINNDKIKNPIYLSTLINLATYLKFYDHTLYTRFFAYLFSTHDMLVKDAVFDYLKKSDKFFKDKGSEERLLNFIHFYAPRLRKLRDVLGLMAYQLLIELKVFEKKYEEADMYFHLYCNLIENTKEPITLIRARQEAHRELLLLKYKQRIYYLVKKVNVKKEFKLELSKYKL